MDVYGIKKLRAAHAPYSISPIPAPKPRGSSSWVSKVIGVKTVPDLGILTTSLGGVANVPIVHRSWGLLGGPKLYGPNFRFGEYMKARNYLTAILFHFTLSALTLLLAFPFVRTVAKRYVYQPGEGPTRDECKNDRVEYRGIGYPDIDTPNPPRAFVRTYYEGSVYRCK